MAEPAFAFGKNHQMGLNEFACKTADTDSCSLICDNPFTAHILGFGCLKWGWIIKQVSRIAQSVSAGEVRQSGRRAGIMIAPADAVSSSWRSRFFQSDPAAIGLDAQQLVDRRDSSIDRGFAPL